MNILKLKTPNSGFPPGGWAFKDPRTGMSFNGMEATLDQQELKIIKHRLANPKVYSQSDINFFDRQYVRQEIFQQLQSRSPGLFVGYEGELVRAVQFSAEPQPSGKCSCGSEMFEPQYCPTCSGRKVIGFKCTDCGKVRSR
jgi:hypothetical protein